MPYDSNGVATINRQRAVTGQTVQAAQVNTPFDDTQSMLSQVLLRSGVAPMTGPLNMSGYSVTNIRDATADTDAVSLSQLKLACPIGTVVDFAGAQAPSTWMLCFGQEISRADNPGLFSAIGTSYGSGNGTTTFNIPDFRGRLGAGKDNMGGTAANRLSSQISGSSLGAVGGAESVILTEAQMPAHTHGGTTSTNGAHTHTIAVGGAGVGGIPTANANTQTGISSTQSAGDHLHNITTDSKGGGQAHSNLQPTIVVNKIIKVSY